MKRIEKEPDSTLLHKEEWDWYNEHFDELQKNGGKWVALGPTGLVATDKDLSAVIQKSHELGVQEPLLIMIPPPQPANSVLITRLIVGL